MPSRSRSFPSVNLALDVPAGPATTPLCESRRRGAGIRALGAAALLLAAAASGCSPYPDDGEFLAGVVYAANFVSGVKQLEVMPAVGRGQGVGAFAPYTTITTTQGAMSTTAVSATVGAASPLNPFIDASPMRPSGSPERQPGELACARRCSPSLPPAKILRQRSSASGEWSVRNSRARVARFSPPTGGTPC